MQQQQFDFNRGAIKPIQCLSDGWAMLKGTGQYGNFLGVLIIGFLIIIVGSCIPLSPLLPPMICGIYLCLFAMMNRQPFNSSTLFRGFDFFGQSFLASLVLTIPIFVLSFVMQIGLGGISAVTETLKENKNPKPEEIFPILFGVFGFVFGVYLLILVVAFILGTLTAFVYPLIVDRKLGAIDALKLSFRAVMGNFFGVVGLMLLGQLILIAGVMVFYVGALFVAPVIFAAWSIAYRRVFPLQVPSQQQFGAPQQSIWTPPVSASKAGWVLTLSALAIIGLGITSLAAVGFFAYRGISSAIEKVEEDRKLREVTKPTPPIHGYPTPTPYQTPTQRSPSGNKTISSGVLNGKAIELPKPPYPPAARAVRASGAVNVQVMIDENGSVISASAVSGHPLLRSSAEQSARAAKFTPTMLGGKAVKVSGVIVYNFVPD
ncbi:MAG: TonB family protein [Acidobacteriota bacterium]|nr:TonB family protein [Acidobacteriota bacterium]